ncbi:MAG: hypothetical protein JSV22_13405, partial [Bacteroidales bacterium]
MMKRIVSNFIFVIIIGAALLHFFSCEKETRFGGNIFEKDMSTAGEIIRTFNIERQLEKVESSNGIFYSIASPDSNYISDSTSDGECMKVFETPDFTPPPTYLTFQSKKDIYYLKSFNYKGKIQLSVEHCLVMLGYSKMGYIEAVILPVKENE